MGNNAEIILKTQSYELNAMPIRGLVRSKIWLGLKRKNNVLEQKLKTNKKGIKPQIVV